MLPGKLFGACDCPVMSAIRVVTLDLWQTLIMDRPELGRERMEYRLQGAMRALAEIGEFFTKEQVFEAYRACYKTCHAIREEERDVSFGDQVKIFIRCIGDGLMSRIDQKTFARIETSYADSFYEAPAPLVQGVPAMLEKLKVRGYRLGLISNTGMTPGRVFRSYMESLGIIGYFDQLAFSDEMLLAKPSSAIFLGTLAKLGCTAYEAVHVGDHLRLDIQGAQRAGMRAIWVEALEAGGSSSDIVADVTIPSIAELPGALDNLIS